MATVLVAIGDLFFASKIDAALAAVPEADRANVERASRGEDLVAQVRARKPRRLLLELASRSFPALDVVRAIKADDSLRGIEIVGFCRHTDGALIASAQEAGCDRVLTQGELARDLGDLLR